MDCINKKCKNGFDYENCSSKEYGHTCDTCINYEIDCGDCRDCYLTEEQIEEVNEELRNIFGETD